MRDANIKLTGEDFNLKFTMENLDKVEREVGKLMLLGLRVSKGDIGLLDIVKFYYYLQGATAYSQDKILDKILSDGISFHVGEMTKALTPVYSGYENSDTSNKKKAE